jgi:hypothetical protein
MCNFLLRIIVVITPLTCWLTAIYTDVLCGTTFGTTYTSMCGFISALTALPITIETSTGCSNWCSFHTTELEASVGMHAAYTQTFNLNICTVTYLSVIVLTSPTPHTLYCKPDQC